MTEMQKIIKQEFDRSENNLNGQKVCKYHRIRKQALDEFLNNGLPTRKNEEWKYTNIGFLNKIEFNFPKPEPSEIDEEIIKKCTFKGLDCYKVVLINGQFSSKYSDNVSEEGIEIISLKKALDEKPNIVEKDLGMHIDYTGHALAAINTAFTFDGVYIEIGNNVQASKPIHIININDSREEALFVNPRKLIKTGMSSNSMILETNHTLGEYSGITNTAAEIILGENTHVDYYKIQDDSENSIYFGYTKAVQAQNSTFNDTTISLHGKFVRNNLNTSHKGSNCETYYNGFFYTDGNQFVDNHTFVDHAIPNCFSDENYKGILDDRSTGIFNGKILVRKDAQQTNAYQSNKNILLSDEATINTKPELEIYADDVKCSHGATSGGISQDEMFYLESRGIDKNKAQAMLLNAFAGDIILRIKLPEVRDIIADKIERRLENKLVKMA